MTEWQTSTYRHDRMTNVYLSSEFPENSWNKEELQPGGKHGFPCRITLIPSLLPITMYFHFISWKSKWIKFCNWIQNSISDRREVELLHRIWCKVAFSNKNKVTSFLSLRKQQWLVQLYLIPIRVTKCFGWYITCKVTNVKLRKS